MTRHVLALSVVVALAQVAAPSFAQQTPEPESAQAKKADSPKVEAQSEASERRPVRMRSRVVVIDENEPIDDVITRLRRERQAERQPERQTQTDADDGRRKRATEANVSDEEKRGRRVERLERRLERARRNREENHEEHRERLREERRERRLRARTQR